VPFCTSKKNYLAHHLFLRKTRKHNYILQHPEGRILSLWIFFEKNVKKMIDLMIVEKRGDVIKLVV